MKQICFNFWSCLLCPRYLTALRGHVSAVYQIAWSADSRLLVSGSSDSTLKVWDAETKKLAIDLPGHADEVSGQAEVLERGRNADSTRDSRINWDFPCARCLQQTGAQMDKG